jgi:hypothetical protein
MIIDSACAAICQCVGVNVWRARLYDDALAHHNHILADMVCSLVLDRSETHLVWLKLRTNSEAVRPSMHIRQ